MLVIRWASLVENAASRAMARYLATSRRILVPTDAGAFCKAAETRASRERDRIGSGGYTEPCSPIAQFKILSVRQRREYAEASEVAMAAEIWKFVKAVVTHFGSWLTGGLIIAAVSMYEHFKGESLSWKFFAVVVAASF